MYSTYDKSVTFRQQSKLGAKSTSLHAIANSTRLRPRLSRTKTLQSLPINLPINLRIFVPPESKLKWHKNMARALWPSTFVAFKSAPYSKSFLTTSTETCF